MYDYAPISGRGHQIAARLRVPEFDKVLGHKVEGRQTTAKVLLDENTSYCISFSKPNIVHATRPSTTKRGKMKKERWTYIDTSVNAPPYPKLPNQAKNILDIIKEKGTLSRPELLGEMQSRVKTKQRGGANRILAYYQGLLVKYSLIDVKKSYTITM